MTRKDIDNILHVICPNDEDFEKPIISPAYLKTELEALALEQEPCEDAISRQAAIEKIVEHIRTAEEPYIINDLDKAFSWGLEVAIFVLSGMPSVQPERKHGHWIIDTKFGADIMSCKQIVICSECYKGIFWGKQNYCPNCGAEMEEGEQE